jgi:hypothetical protein
VLLDGMPAASPDDLDRLEAAIGVWLGAMHEGRVDRGAPGERRWLVHLAGENKDVITVWLTLGQRALHVETYLMPAPERFQAEVFEHLMRRNRQARGMWLCIGDEDAIFLVGHLPLALVDEANLDRVLGTAYAAVDQWYEPAMRLAWRGPAG